jgi:hypothetical protein
MNYENTRRHKILGVLLEHSEICAACATYLNGDIESDTAPCNFGRMIFKIGNFIFCYTDDNGNFDFPPSASPSPLPSLQTHREDN